MNQFIQAAKELIYGNGIAITYTAVAEGNYNVELGSTTNTETNSNVIAFPKSVKVSSFNYPSLVGKQVLEFLVVANDLSAAPSPQDKILYRNIAYNVDSYKEHMAEGELVIYKIIVVKG